MLEAITENPMNFKVISCLMTSTVSSNDLLTNFELENPDLRLVLLNIGRRFFFFILFFASCNFS